jgi:predicted  nucleic acid-binding Zn-ribbon protein
LSIPEQIRTLEELAGVDAELKVLEDQLSQERATLAALKASLKRLDEKRKNDLLSVAATEKARNELVIDVRGMMQQLDHSREKLNRSRTERESNAAQRELEELRKLVRDREEDINKLTAEGDAVQLQIEATEAETAKLAAELGSSEGDINSKVAAVEREREQKAAARETVAKRLPPVLYRRYETLRTKKPCAISQTTDGTCTACHMALPPQIFHRLRREPMIEQCPSCQRLIYFVPPPPRQVAPAAGASAANESPDADAK